MNRKSERDFGLTVFLAVAAFFIAESTWAAGGLRGPMDGFERAEPSSTDKVREAYDAIKNTDEIRSMLNEEGGTRHSLAISQRIKNTGVETTKFQHFFKGLEVVGSMALHHRGGRNNSDVQNVLARFDLDAKPRLSADEAASLAKAVAGDRELSRQPELKVLPNDDGDSARLVYWVKLEKLGNDHAREVIIDAHTGEIVGNLSTMMPIADVSVYSAAGQGVVGNAPEVRAGHGFKAGSESETAVAELLRRISHPSPAASASASSSQCQVIDSASGAPIQINAQACQLVVNHDQVLSGADEAAREALRNSERVLDYYKSVHNRDSYDDKGSNVINVVHVGKNFDNAAWISDQNIMIYGDGDGEQLGSFTAAIDVAGHEMTHGVTAHTAKLNYMGESGALNEAYSDFFGKMIEDKGDWVLGRDLYLDHSHAEGFRDLENPGRLKAQIRDENGNRIARPYPSKMSEKFSASGTCDGTNDHCYVHINSTIPGHASYLVFQALGKDQAEKLYYLTLTQYLTSRANFRSTSLATQKACARLYDSSTCAKVKAAFAQVGL